MKKTSIVLTLSAFLGTAFLPSSADAGLGSIVKNIKKKGKEHLKQGKEWSEAKANSSFSKLREKAQEKWHSGEVHGLFHRAEHHLLEQVKAEYTQAKHMGERFVKEKYDNARGAGEQYVKNQYEGTRRAFKDRMMGMGSHGKGGS